MSGYQSCCGAGGHHPAPDPAGYEAARWTTKPFWTLLRLVSLATLIIALGPIVGEPAYPHLSPAQKERLHERDQLATEADRLRDEGKLPEAIATTEKMLAIERELFGEAHDDIASSLEGLFEMHCNRDELAAARAAGEARRTVLVKLYGSTDWRTKWAQEALAQLERDSRLPAESRRDLALANHLLRQAKKLSSQGKFPDAVAAAERAVSLRQRILGAADSRCAGALSRLADVYRDMGDYPRAEPVYQQALEINRKAFGEEHPEFAASLNNLAEINRLVPGGAAIKDGRLQPDDVILEMTNATGKWESVAGKSTEGVRALMVGQVGTKVGLRVRRGEETQAREITLMRAPLPMQSKFDWTSEPRYVAFVVRHEGPVLRLDLGPIRPVNEAVDAWRESYGMSGKSAAAAKLLRQRVWEPIARRLGNARTVLLSPDGTLSRMPFGALPGKEAGSYLIEECPLAIVPTAQMIPEMVRGARRRSPTDNLLLVGNIDYDAPLGTRAGRTDDRANTGRDGPKGRAHFNHLPATQREVALIEKLYHQDVGAAGIALLENQRATKGDFLVQAGRSRYLHLATHGFFLEEEQGAPQTQGSPKTAAPGGLLGGPSLGELHVGLRSGLAMAGANRAALLTDLAAEARGPAGNGILTAEEIGALNLDAVQLVMLSACDTGLGQEAGGEGLLGLQRSFQAAGARSVVASLWKVPDEETMSLMGLFYTNLWKKKLSPLESLRQAQLAMLHSVGAETGRSRAPDFSHTSALPAGGGAEKPAAGGRALASPFAWAAFVLSGDWR